MPVRKGRMKGSDGGTAGAQTEQGDVDAEAGI